MTSFDHAFDPQWNRLLLVRHAAAAAVFIDHAFILSGRGHVLSSTGFGISLGLLGVATFFVISGALVTASYLNSRSWKDFVWRRILRIYPAYFVCLLITVTVIAPVAVLASPSVDGPAFRKIAAYASEEPTPGAYVMRNLFLAQMQNRIGDLYKDHAEEYSVNGSLWSIPWEACCYAIVFGLGCAGIIGSRRVWLPVMTALAYVHFIVVPEGSILGRYYLSPAITLLPIYFLGGATFYLYRDKIPCHPLLGVGAVVTLLGLGIIHWPTASLFLPYCVFWLALRSAPQQMPVLDLSYGIYIYSFPIQQTLLSWTDEMPIVPFTICSFLLALPLAAISWYLVEKPCMRLKWLTILRSRRR